ncbi:MAG: sugar phosphate isomerase/epimerase family protein [Armatimonadota bacterium]
MSQIPVALQLYTVRDVAGQDFIGTLKRVAKIGYAGVEFAGNYGGLSAKDLKFLLDDLNLRAAASHIGMNAFDEDIDAVIEYQLEIGSRFVVIPGMPLPETAEGWREVAARMNAIGETCKQRGLQLCFHNHAGEFARFDGAYGLDLLYQFSDPAFLQAELDLYWVKKGGEDPVAYINQYAGRVPLLHVKDMTADPEPTFAEVGTGILDWDGIFAAAPAAGTQWYIVEQDVCQRPSMESVEISFRNLQAWGIA